MNKFEMELNENKAKAFFVRHGEKLGLGVAAVLLGVFVYLGTGLEPDLEGRTPSTLETLVINAESRITSGRWDDLRPHRLAVADAAERLDGNLACVSASEFNYE